MLSFYVNIYMKYFKLNTVNLDVCFVNNAYTCLKEVAVEVYSVLNGVPRPLNHALSLCVYKTW